MNPPTKDPEDSSRRALGAFLRAHRERLAPPKPGGRRRTPGLRREELADACGVSSTWVTWLEQGRDVSASSTALGRLAEGLRLTTAERASLFDLAGKRDPAAPPAPSTELPPEMLALPSLFSVPAYLLDHAWTARAWNPAAGRLFEGWLDPQSGERNLLRYVFLAPGARALLDDWPQRARRLVAEFRADFSRRPRDPALQSLIDVLSRDSEAFQSSWAAQEVKYREGGERVFHHALDGTIRYVQTTLVVAPHPECKLVCLVPGASASSTNTPPSTGERNRSRRTPRP
jgi:transcriptional regulator with XRE-family HTH domain